MRKTLGIGIGSPTQAVFDNDSENEPNLAVSMLENSSEVTPIAVEIIPTVAETTDATIQTLYRIRKRPTWIKDYEVTEIDDLITHFAPFSYCDLIVFEDVVKNSKWRKAMDDEITAIERNNT
jgi:hypothetical protein